MPCALTSGYTLDCRDSKGGIKEVYFIEFDNVSSYTEASGTVTAITKASGKVFRKYSLIKQTSNFEEAITGSEENGSIFYAQTLNVIINKMNVSVRNEIKLLAQNRLMAVVADNNGKYWLLGKEGALTLNAGTGGSGTAYGDRNGYTLTFSGAEGDPAPEVSSGIIAGLTS